MLDKNVDNFPNHPLKSLSYPCVSRGTLPKVSQWSTKLHSAWIWRARRRGGRKGLNLICKSYFFYVFPIGDKHNSCLWRNIKIFCIFCISKWEVSLCKIAQASSIVWYTEVGSFISLTCRRRFQHIETLLKIRKL